MNQPYDYRIVRYHYCRCASLAASMYCLLHLCFQSGIELLFFIFEGGTICITKWICMNFFSISLWCGSTFFLWSYLYVWVMVFDEKFDHYPYQDEEKFYRRKIFRGNCLNFISLMFEELDWSNSTQNEAILKSFSMRRKNCFRGVSLPKSFQQCEWVVGFLCRPIWEATSHKLINLLLRSIGTNLRVFLQKNSSLKPPHLTVTFRLLQMQTTNEVLNK